MTSVSVAMCVANSFNCVLSMVYRYRWGVTVIGAYERFAETMNRLVYAINRWYLKHLAISLLQFCVKKFPRLAMLPCICYSFNQSLERS